MIKLRTQSFVNKYVITLLRNLFYAKKILDKYEQSKQDMEKDRSFRKQILLTFLVIVSKT